MTPQNACKPEPTKLDRQQWAEALPLSDEQPRDRRLLEEAPRADIASYPGSSAEQGEAYTTKNAILGGHLMALKWLGNAGSHDGSLNKDDLLDAFEVLDHVLAEIIDERSERVAALAAAMAKKHTK